MQAIRQKTPRKYLTLSVMTIILCSLFSWTAFAAGGAKVKKLSVTNSKVEVQEGKAVTISAKVTATTKTAPKQLKVKAKSSNPGIAEVKIVRVPGEKAKTGTSVIEIVGKKTGSCKITVTTATKNKKGKRLTKTITVTVGKVKYSSSDPDKTETGSSGTGNSYDSGKTDTNISNMWLNADRVFCVFDGKYIGKHYFTLKVGNYSGQVTFKVSVEGGGTDEKTYTVSANKTYKLICKVSFWGSSSSRFDIEVTMPDGNVQKFSSSSMNGSPVGISIQSFYEE